MANYDDAVMFYAMASQRLSLCSFTLRRFVDGLLDYMAWPQEKREGFVTEPGTEQTLANQYNDSKVSAKAGLRLRVGDATLTIPIEVESIDKASPWARRWNLTIGKRPGQESETYSDVDPTDSAQMAQVYAKASWVILRLAGSAQPSSAMP